MEISETKKYNYHTHINSDSLHNANEYILNARLNGKNIIGFIDYAPTSELEFPNDSKNVYSNILEYISLINNLKRTNPDMTILCGLETEYDEIRESYLGELREKVDYIILGIHDEKNLDNSPNYPIEYAKKVCQGIESGIFDLVVHPDEFLKHRSNMETEEKRNEFDNNSKKAIELITSTALTFNIPLELNPENIKDTIEFWKIASLKRNRVLLGKNIKSSKEFSELSNTELDNLIQNLHLNFVQKEYNPILDRLQNQRLNYTYRNRQSKVTTIYTSLSKRLLTRIFETIPKTDDKETIIYYINSYLDNAVNIDGEKTNSIDQHLLEKLETISNTNLSISEKSRELTRIKNEITRTNEVLQRRISLINLIKDSVKYAFGVGTNNEQDVIEIVTSLIEIKTTKNDSNKRILIDKITEIEERLKTNEGKEDVAKLIRHNPAFNNDSPNPNTNLFIWSNNGFINLMTLAIIVSFILGFGIGLAYMILKIN